MIFYHNPLKLDKDYEFGEIFTSRHNLINALLAHWQNLDKQVNGRTSKIFTNEHVEPGAWFQENHDWGQRQRVSTSAADKE